MGINILGPLIFIVSPPEMWGRGGREALLLGGNGSGSPLPSPL